MRRLLAFTLCLVGFWTVIAAAKKPVKAPLNVGIAIDHPAPTCVGCVATPRPMVTVQSFAAMLIAYTMRVTGSPFFNGRLEPWNTCPEPASVRLLIQKANDWSTDFGRWWSNPLHMELAEGYAELSVPLSPDQWTSVYGSRADSSQAALSAWQALVNKPAAIGLTFGGGCFFGHGVLVQGGTATMTVTSFRAS